MMTVERKNPDWIKELRQRHQLAGGKVVALGWPVGTQAVSNLHPGRKKGKPPKKPVPILLIAFWNQYGTKRIPPRDFLTPGGNAAIEKTETLRANLARAVNAGEDQDRILERMGSVGAAEVKKAIRDLSEPENAESTKRIKKSENPLIDTSTTVQSVTYAVRER
jgi:hypothetical protein